VPQDQQKRQKALMKKRSKQKAAAKSHTAHQTSTSVSFQTLMRDARSYPLFDCWITSNWKKSDLGLIEILVSRKQPDGNICFGFYLVDNYCLGLKNTLVKANVPLGAYQSEVVETLFRGEKPAQCDPELAHQMIYAAIDYAAQFGFQPHSDFTSTQNLLMPRGELAEPYKLTFGKNGKPFFISGPNDNALRIVKQLEKTAGPGNFDYVAMSGSPF
jgi:hypothetical protein